ncbi:D Chain D, Coupling Of Remote Alternating-access Transport Mechanisms For Protons And Substrates In The, partial [Paramuricea clavata]
YTNMSQLLTAATEANFQEVKRLVESGDDVNEKHDDGRTVLHYAVSANSLKIVKYLVEHGAEVINLHTHGSDTILFLACEKGNESIVDYLLQNGATKDINKYGDDRVSPLSIASEKGHTAVVQTLLKYNVDMRKDKQLVCGNEEIINIINWELKKSIKYRKKLKELKALDNKKLTK